MKSMPNDIRQEVLRRLEDQYGLKHRDGTLYMRKGKCPACGKKELYSRSDEPWFIKCGRPSKCGQQWHVKELFDDLFDDYSKQHPATEKEPAASANAYLQWARGFDLNLVKGWYTQENYYSRDLGFGSATVRFPLEHGGYWERLIDRPHRFGKLKARFAPGKSPRGYWWCPPSIDLLEVDELWIVEGIFDAIALLHHGIAAVSAMSSVAFPFESLKALAKARTEADKKLPTLVWALDNEPGAHHYTRKHAAMASELGYRCEAAQIPQRDRKADWNDLHQRWMFIDEPKRSDVRAQDLKAARYHGALLLAENASEKALLMYDWREQGEFHFGFDNRLYWFKLDLEKFNQAMRGLEDSDDHDEKLLNTRQMREKALRQAGCVVEIANCYPQALYFQRNEITDESWYYFRVDFPHDEPTVRNTFTGGQVAAASEFKKRLLGMAAGAVFTGSGAQLDKIMKEQLFGLKTVKTIDYIGYSKEHACYVFGDLAVRGGVVVPANAEDYFEFKDLRLKTLQKSIKLAIARTDEGYRPEWLDWLWTCFNTQGVIALAYYFGSLFCEQIRAEFQSFPFLEVTGEAGAGKSTLLMFLWKLLGRPDEEGKDPSKMSKAGLRRWLSQISGMPVVMLEADRSDDKGNAAKAFDWDEFKPLFNGGSLGVTGVKTAGNETHEPPFRAALVISQNATVVASEAILTRIVRLHFIRPEVTSASRAAADNLNLLQVEDVSHFLLMAVKIEQKVMEVFRERVRVYEQELRALREIRIERIIKNHAQLMALVDALCLVAPLPDRQRDAVIRELSAMAVARQHAVNADPQEVAEFWEVFDYLESLHDHPMVNHSKNPERIAINLNEFCERAAEHKQRLADATTLRTLLVNSRSRPFIDKNLAVDSAVRAAFNARNTEFNQRATTVKCWVFKAT
ncbi:MULTISPECIES: toprim domain-containing protein [unclassified Pseudomonas]|uniref:toprim domain-containing protein n=1 Tax=unclassified Pseudomonas TaxID=196821 RepID=UPI0024471A1C|nr:MULTISPECIES: toprim domain-containing protein [unclassified Pseudomonas]MDH0894665.1 toprim domain-containing protein [Pseudomonas sp. GD03875]MDH1067285.1 toprim domain-containing protein [Pseudomonas sp. GD03985]